LDVEVTKQKVPMDENLHCGLLRYWPKRSQRCHYA